jgi:hypothetical protein
MVVFTPESQVGMGTQDVNYLSIFLVTGGHIWTLGRSEQNSGLAANFPQPAAFPASFRFDMASDPSDTSGVFCMGYKDYCVSVVDKVWGVFRSGEDMPPGVVRNMDRDAMRFAYRDLFDPVTAMHPELPESLQLWEEVTAPGRFFDPAVRGFTYVEVYDPDYYMYWMYLSSQSCFHPMYRMKTRNSLSVLSNGAVALWLTKYEEVVPIVESGIAVAAPSVHFGLPLWFFDRDDVDQIVDVIFDEWQINTAR